MIQGVSPGRRTPYSLTMRQVLFTCILFLTSCMCRDLHPIPDEPEQPHWVSATTQPTRGVFVIVHGLNQRPSSMDSLQAYLGELGFHSYRITLEGHYVSNDQTFEALQWEQDVRMGIREATTRYPTLPLYLLGYSLGGLLVTDVLEQDAAIHPAKVVLLAPALSLHTFIEPVRLFTIIPFGTLRTMNFAPRGYRRFPNTPFFWYANTAEIYESTSERRADARLKSIPTLIVVSPDDELISPSGLEEWVEQNDLRPMWRIEMVAPEPLDSRLHRHLIIDQNSLGDAEWTRMKVLLRDFLVSP